MRLLNNLKKEINIHLDVVKSNKIKIIYQKLYDILNSYKNKIDENNAGWDRMKKIGNPNELIHISFNKETKNDSISAYIPLSRSYFKLWEMIIDYNLLDANKKQNIACLAEGPGGFMEAIINNRQKNIDNGMGDKIYGITLYPNSKSIPGWKKISENKISKNCHISYGNLYNLSDIKIFTHNFKDDGVDMVTADGGFDYSVDFNNQEKLSYRIILCEIVTTLSIQKIGGIFVCKIFDIFTIFTIKLVYLLYCLYDEMYIVKPQTSRLANSEKYVIAKGFRGFSELGNGHLLEDLYKIVNNWDDQIMDVSGIELDNNFLELIYYYNTEYVNDQIYYLKKTIDLMNNKPSKEIYNQIIKPQVINATNWCKKYGIDINNNSKYLLFSKKYD